MAAYQAPPSLGFSRQEHWSGLPLPSLMTNLDSVLKTRDNTLPTNFGNKGPYSQSYGFSSSHVQMREKCWSHGNVRLFATPWTIAHQAPLSMGLSRQEYWSGLPFPSPGDLSNPGIKTRSPALQANSLPSEPCKRWALKKTEH